YVSSSPSIGNVNRWTVALGFLWPLPRFGPLSIPLTMPRNTVSALSRWYNAVSTSSGLMMCILEPPQPPQLPVIRLRPLGLAVQVRLLDADEPREQPVQLRFVKIDGPLQHPVALPKLDPDGVFHPGHEHPGSRGLRVHLVVDGVPQVTCAILKRCVPPSVVSQLGQHVLDCVPHLTLLEPNHGGSVAQRLLQAVQAARDS